MDKGARTVARILIVALLLGVVVLAANAKYRRTLLSVWKGEPERSPIWLSNEDYYPEVKLHAEDADAKPE